MNKYECVEKCTSESENYELIEEVISIFDFETKKWITFSIEKDFECEK